MHFYFGHNVLLAMLLGQVVIQGTRIHGNRDRQQSECRESYTCKRSNEAPSNLESLWNISCYCDELCQSYGDCCWPNDPRNSSNSSVKVRRLLPEVITCQDMGKNNQLGLNLRDVFAKYIYIVSKCPKKFKEKYTIKMCQNVSGNDMLTQIPVNGRKSKILYRNYYCAACNEESDVVFWTGRVDIRSAVPFHEKSKGEPNISWHDAVFSPVEGYEPRLCKVVIRECAKDWKDEKIAKRCEKISGPNAYVYSVSYDSNSQLDDAFESVSLRPSMTVYRNKYCAKCNYVNKTRCSPPPSMFRYPSLSGKANLVPFSVVMEINPTDGDTTIETIDHMSKRNSTLHRCASSPLQVYDPSIKGCRTINCPADHRLTETGCSKRRTKPRH